MSHHDNDNAMAGGKPSAIGASGDAVPAWQVTLWPHRSLSPRGLRIFLTILGSMFAFFAAMTFLAPTPAEIEWSGHLGVDTRGETCVEGVWAVGDVTDRGGTTHLANAWGRRLVQSIALPLVPNGSEPERPAAVFTNPEVASIGEQPDVVGDDVIRVTVDVADLDRSLTDGLEHGILIVDVRRFTGTVLGATIVGPRAGELITTFSLAMKAGIAFHRWYGTVFPYPTYSEVIGRAVDAYMAETLPAIPQQFGKWAKGRGNALRRRLRGVDEP